MSLSISPPRRAEFFLAARQKEAFPEVKGSFSLPLQSAFRKRMLVATPIASLLHHTLIGASLHTRNRFVTTDKTTTALRKGTGWAFTFVWLLGVLAMYHTDHTS